MREIILYSTHCPKCQVLEKKLLVSGLTFKSVEDHDKIVEVAKRGGFTMAPILEVSDVGLMGFADAVKWVNENSSS